jgi:hypothetical protein
VLASLAMLARDKRALCVAAGGSAPPISFVALYGLSAARSGLRVTTPTGVRLRVGPLRRCGFLSAKHQKAPADR